MTHIAIERNRRKQMNDYLSVLRSLIPPSYGQRGDQASIAGGAINYVKELEQHLQSLEFHKRIQQQSDDHVDSGKNFSSLFSGFFSIPQYSACSVLQNNKRSSVAQVEETKTESHANLKIQSKRYLKQIFKMITEFDSLRLNILQLNVTTFDHVILYSFSVKVEQNCHLNSVNKIAAAVYAMMGRVQEETAFIGY